MKNGLLIMACLGFLNEPSLWAQNGQVASARAARSADQDLEGIAVGYAGHFACRQFSGVARELAIAVSDLERKDAERLLKAGASINATADATYAHGMTLLQTAVVYHWGADAVQMLIELGAEVDAQDERGHTALTLGANSPCGMDPQVIVKLIEAGAQVDGKGPGGMTPLMFAALNDRTGDVVKVLLESSAKVATQDKRGWTALMHATRRRRDPIRSVEMLVEAGAPVRAKNAAGGTALSNAAFQGHARTVQFLIRSGADVNSRDRAQWTPLICASLNGHARVAKLLIGAGASVDAADQLGRTAMSLARSKGDTALVNVLTNSGAAK